MVHLAGFKAFLKRKDIEFSLRRYGIDALGAMAQGLFCSLLIGTILNTLGSQTGVAIFSTVGGYATAVSGPAMAVAIGYALKCPPLVLFSMVPVGWAANALGGSAGGRSPCSSSPSSRPRSAKWSARRRPLTYS